MIGRPSRAEPGGVQRFHIRGGRVIDPGLGRDEVADLWVHDGVIATTPPETAGPTVVINARGLIVGPGFVDLHSHTDSVAGHRLHAKDGVTTALDLEAGRFPVETAYRLVRTQRRPLNYGFSTSWGAARARAMNIASSGVSLDETLALLSHPGFDRPLSDGELAELLGALSLGIGQGGLGIGVLQGFAAHADPEELEGVGRLAASMGVPLFVHMREMREVDPSVPIDGVAEVIGLAVRLGASIHVCHINSTVRRRLRSVLEQFASAISEGAAITLETYPYGSGSAPIGSGFLAPENLHIWGITPHDITLLTNGRTIETIAELAEVRAADPDAACVVRFLDESAPEDQSLITDALQFRGLMVASDSGPVNWPGGIRDSIDWPLPSGGLTHPRASGTFARAISMMVNDLGLWDWPTAFVRCSYLPARLLEAAAPAARRKGHLGVGADADIVILDPLEYRDNATYSNPTEPSTGVRYLFVSGVPLIWDGNLRDIFPGRPLLSRQGNL